MALGVRKQAREFLPNELRILQVATEGAQLDDIEKMVGTTCLGEAASRSHFMDMAFATELVDEGKVVSTRVPATKTATDAKDS